MTDSSDPGSADTTANDKMELYFQLLGRFIHLFARIESACHVLFRFVLNMPDDEARLISAGMRLTDVLAITRRLVPRRNLSDAEVSEVESALSQLDQVSKLRDTLVHRGAEVIGRQLVSHNQDTARYVAEIIPIELGLIEDAISDCVTIRLKLEWVARREGDTWWDLPLAQSLRAQPWRYKRPQPVTWFELLLPTSPGPQPRPQSSQD